MLPKEIIEKFIYDFNYAMESGAGRACEGKIQYTTMNLATLAAYRMDQYKGEEFNPYTCPFCGFYHIGHSRGERSLGYKLGKLVRKWRST